MSEGTLKATRLCKSYGKKDVLRGLDLELLPGGIYGLIGRNGAGKTTLLSILTAQNTWDEGEVTLNGEPVWENRHALDQLCFARELSPALKTGGANALRVKDYLRAASIYYPNWDAPYAERLLKEFGLDKERKTRVDKLSKGMMSMVTITLALASRAPFTFLDEPVAGLDVVARERFYQLLLEDYGETSRTFVVSTHILDETNGVFERVVILDEGKVLENIPTDSLLEQFRLVDGPAEAVEAVCAGLKVLSKEHLGRRLSCVVRGTPEQLAALPADLDAGALNLQKVFVALCGHGEVLNHE